MANGAIFNTAIGQQFSGNNRKTNTLINVNDGNPIDTEVTPEATPKEKAEATPQYRLNKEKVLDNALRDRGLVLQPASKKDQDKYWKGLTKEMQDQMSQYYKDGYSFAGARALLEQQYGKNPQSLKVQRAGEAKGSDTWIGAVQDSIPMKIADWVNILGKGTEYLMNAEQQVTQDTQGWINEKIGAREGSTLFRDRANKSLKEKIDALPEEKVSQLTAEYNEDSNRGKMRRKAYGTLDNYIEEKTKNRWQEMLGIGTIGGDPYKGFAWDRVLVNAPRSALDLATASLYAQTNPVDNLSDLAYLFTTKEGRGILKDQYGSLDKLQETMESDPFGFISDLMDAKDLISRSKSRLKQVEGKVNQSKLNKKKNEVTKLNKEIQDELKEDREKNTATSFDTLEKGGKLYELEKEQKGLEEKQNSIDESKEKWDERAQQASDLSDVFSTEPINKAIIGYLSEKGGIGKTLAYWYSLTQDPLSTIWNGVATEKQVEQTKPQTLDELDEGKEPEKETITVTDKVAPGISDSKAVQNVGEVWKRIRDKWEERTTGLTPDMKARIQQNPYVKAYWDQIKATIEDEGLSNQEQIIEEQFLEEIGNELLARIEKEENRVEETGVMYNNIRDLPQTFDFTSTAEGIANTFDRAGITIRPDGSLFFRNWSEAMTTDRSHSQILWNLMQKFINGQALTASEFLDLRSQLKAIENYKKGMDPTSAGKSAMLARQLRTEINKLAHKEIPGLSEIDAQYHKQISYLQQLKKDITYAQGPNSGKVRSNFYSIIRNINSANRKQYAGIIAGIFPEVKDRVEAVRLMPKLIKAYQKNSGLLQSVVNMPKLLSAAQIASGDGFIKSAMTLLIGQFVEEGIVRPVDKKLRQATIDEVINELDPIAKLKLEEAIKNAQDGEKLTKEEEMIIQEVTKKIAQSIEEYRENLPKLPSPKADVADEKGNVTLGRGQPNTPEPQRRSIIEINLYKPEAKKEEIQKIQEENNVDQQTAEKIDNTLQAFLEEMGATNGTVNVEQVDYNNFSTPTLNELRVSDRIPQVEKEKIESILKERLEHTDDGERQKMDKYFAVKIDNLNEEEQRIGKVGKNKVNKEYQDQQKRAHETKKEKIIKEIEQFYFDGDPDSAIKAEDKFKELEATPRDVINSYKKSQNYIYESAERELLNRYLKEWDKQPKFLKKLNTKQLDVRTQLLDSVDLEGGYEIETNDYNDRYVKKENGKIVDRGSIKYTEDGKILIMAQDINGFLASGIINYLPDETILMISGDDTPVTIKEIRYSDVSPENQKSVFHGTDAPNIEKFDTNFIGAGEGTNVHGAGIYLAVNPGIARNYAKNVASMKVGENERKPVTYKGQKVSVHRGRDHTQYSNYVGDNSNIDEGNSQVNEFIEYVVSKRGWKDRYENINATDFEIRKDEFIGMIREKIEKSKDWLENSSRRVSEQFRESQIEREKRLIKGYEKAIDRITNDIKFEDFEFPSKEEVTRNFYTVEIPERMKADTPSGWNYIEEDDIVPVKVWDDIIKKLLDSGITNYAKDYITARWSEGYYQGNKTYEKLYKFISEILGPKRTSEFLNSLGYEGIHYYGARDGECYVIFNGDSIEILSKEQFSKGNATAGNTSEPFDYISNKQYKKVGDMDENDVKEGIELYNKAKTDRNARREFLILKQQPGYLEKLGLNRAEVNEQIKERTEYKEGVKELSDELNEGVNPENQYLGLQNISAQPRLASNISALKSLTKKVTGSEDGAYIPYMIDAILAFNSDIVYKLLSVEAGEIGNDVLGLYRPATDKLVIGKQYQHTASHETAHYIDFLWGRELFGGSSYAPKYLTNPKLDMSGLTPEQREFYKQFKDFITKLESRPSVTAKMKDRLEDKPYRTAREEIFARFGEAFIDWVKKTAKEGVNQKDFKKQGTDAGDVFTLEDFKEFVSLIQKKSELTGLKEAKTPTEEFKNRVLGEGYQNDNQSVQQQSLFDETKKTFTEQEMNDAFDKARPKIDSVIERIAINQNRNADYPPYRIFLSILEGYSPDIQEWMKNIHKDIKLSIRKSLEVREVIGLYHGLEQFLSSPEIKAWVEDNFKKNGHFGKELYDVMKRMEKEPLQIPEKYQNEKELGPLRNYLYDLEGINMSALVGTYDADPIEWKQNINKALLDKASRSLTLSKIYNIKNLLQDYIKNAGDKPVAGTFDDEGIQKLVDLEKEGMKQKISTYDKKQIQKIGYELNSALSPRIVDVSKYIESIDSDVYESEFVPQVIYTIGKTYNPDIEVWQQNLKEPIRELIDQYPKRKTPNADTKIISDDALNGLKAKINELEKYSIKDIQNAFEGQEAELFMRAVKPQIDKLQAEGMNNAVRDLVALHNMELENFKKQIKKFDGKSPMPSIAVMDPNVPHEVFGDLTLVFGKGTVDPKNNPDNKLYGSDAWTPMFPEIERTKGMSYKDIVDKTREIIKPLKEEYETYGKDRPENFRFDVADSLEDLLEEYTERSDLNENADRLAEQLVEDLIEGLPLSKKYYMEAHMEIADGIKDEVWDLFEKIEGAKDVIPARYFNPKQPNYGDIEHVNNVSKKIVEILPKKGIEKLHDEGYIEGGKMNSFEEGIFREFSDAIEGIEDFPNNTPQEAGEGILDLFVNGYGFDKETILPYVEDVFGSLDDTSKDRPLTPENVLEAMKNQGVRREVEPGTFRDLIEIEGHELNDIEDVRKQNFAKVFHGDRTGDLGDLEKRYYDILDIIMTEYIPYEEGRPLARLTMDAIKNSYDTDVKKFQENMNKEYKRKEEIPTDILQSIIDVVEQGKKVPIRFSESKPERVVDLYNEVRYILVPKGDVSKAKEIVKGTPLENKLVEYTPDNHSAPRARKLKELQKQYGNVFFQMGGVIMPIGMLLKMAETLGGGGDDDQQEEIA